MLRKSNIIIYIIYVYIIWSKQQEADKTKFMYFKQDGAISTLNGKSLKLVHLFINLGSNISSTESNVNICILKRDLLLTDD